MYIETLSKYADIHPTNPLFFAFSLIDPTDYTFTLETILNIVLIFKALIVPVFQRWRNRKANLKCLLKYTPMCRGNRSMGMGVGREESKEPGTTKTTCPLPPSKKTP